MIRNLVDGQPTINDKILCLMGLIDDVDYNRLDKFCAKKNVEDAPTQC
jgi:hypothetical protein